MGDRDEAERVCRRGTRTGRRNRSEGRRDAATNERLPQPPKTFRVDAKTIDEHITTDGQKIQEIQQSKLTVQRPGALRVDRVSPVGHTVFRDDGTRFSAYDKEQNIYATAAAPATLDAAVDEARDRLRIDARGGDLIVSNPYASLIDGTLTGRYIGLEPIVGVMAHHLAIALGLATMGVVHVPGPPVEAAIALSILLVAVELVHLERRELGHPARRPWVVAFAFGLLHGFGFASALTDVGLPRGDIPLALFAFNVGVECGQLAFVSAVFGVVAMVMWLRVGARVARYARRTVSYAIGTLAAFWFFDRLTRF